MSPVVEIVYDMHSNVSLVLFTQNSIGVDFSGATRFTLAVGGVVVDTDVDPTAIESTAVQGELKFDIGDKGIPVGTHNATLVVFDPIHLSGQVLACADDESLMFKVKVCT